MQPSQKREGAERKVLKIPLREADSLVQELLLAPSHSHIVQLITSRVCRWQLLAHLEFGAISILGVLPKLCE
jgi:hypothetical protein